MKAIVDYRLFIPLALVPLLLLFLASCSSTQPGPESLSEGSADQWNKAVEKVISEPQRAAELKRLGHEMIDVSKSIMKDVDDFSEKTAALNKNYAATKEDLQKLVEAFRQKRDPKFDQYRDIIFAMRARVSKKEWEELTR